MCFNGSVLSNAAVLGHGLLKLIPPVAAGGWKLLAVPSARIPPCRAWPCCSPSGARRALQLLRRWEEWSGGQSQLAVLATVLEEPSCPLLPCAEVLPEGLLLRAWFASRWNALAGAEQPGRSWLDQAWARAGAARQIG